MNFIVIDDNQHHLEIVTKALEKTYPDAFVVSCNDYSSLKDFTTPYDVALIDMVIQKKSGIEIAIELRKIYPQLKLAFMSSHNNLIFNVQELDALCFIRKDHFKNDFAIFNRLLKRYLEQNKMLVFHLYGQNRQRDNMIYINTSDIVYVDAQGDCIEIHLYYTSYKVMCRFKDFIRLLDGLKQFERIHRSIVINMRYVQFIDDQKITMKCSYKTICLRPSRSFHKHFLQAFKEYIAL